MDLIAFYRTNGFKFSTVMKEALRAYARKENYCIKLSKDSQMRDGYVPRSVQLHIAIDSKKDKDIVDMLSQMRVGYRNSFLKALFRKYATTEPLDVYKDRDDLIFDEEKDYITERRKKPDGGKEQQDNKAGHDKDRKPKPPAKEHKPSNNQRNMQQASEQRQNKPKQQPQMGQQRSKPPVQQAQVKPAAQNPAAIYDEHLPFSEDNAPVQMIPDDRQQAKSRQAAAQQAYSKPGQEQMQKTVQSENVNIVVPPAAEQPSPVQGTKIPDSEPAGGLIAAVTSDDNGDDLSSILAVMDKVAHST